MAYIDNSETLKELNEAIRGNVVSNIAPNGVNNSIQPVINVNPKDYRRCNIVKSGTTIHSTTTTIYTTPTDKDLFICSAFISVIKDVGSTSILTRLRASVDGVVSDILNISTLTTTIQNSNNSISFPNPIKIDRGTAITLTNSANVANVSASGGFSGYTVEA
jgi:hypothetical protein